MTPYYTAGVWTGYDDNTEQTWDEMHTSEMLWHAIMSRVHSDLEFKQFEQPEGLVQVAVCSESGLLPIEGLCDNCVITEYFAEGSVPTETCNCHYSGNVCVQSGKPATDLCPFAVQRIMTRNPDNLEENAIPSEIVNMAVTDYKGFLIKRRQLMAKLVEEYYKSL